MKKGVIIVAGSLVILGTGLILLFSAISDKKAYADPHMPGFDFVDSWGSYGSSDGLFDGTMTGLSVDQAGNVYAVDSENSRVQKFGPDGSFLLKWGDPSGILNKKFNHPCDLAVSPGKNRIYVCDTYNNSIQTFTLAGDFVASWGEAGGKDGQMNLPEGIAVGPSGDIYVADTGNNRIQKFTSDGRFVLKWGGSGGAPGRFARPIDLSIDGQGNIVVLDRNNFRVQKFDPSGAFISAWRLGANTCSSIAVDADSYAFLSNSDLNCIDIYSHAGEYLASFGENQFQGVSGLAFDGRNLYAGDFVLNSILKFRKNMRGIEPSPMTNTI